MIREIEVATYLRGDPALDTLVPGGVYAGGALGEEGITDATHTPDIWTGGTFQTCIVVRQGDKVPTGRFVSFRQQTTETTQAVRLYMYSLTLDGIDAVGNRLYALMMGKRFSGAYPTEPGSVDGPRRAPELPGLVWVTRADYVIRDLRRAA